MQRREFLKALASLPLLAAVPFQFKPRSVQEIVDGWAAEGAVTQVAIWNKALSAEEVAFYVNERPTRPEDMPAFENLQRWYRLGITPENSFAAKRQWVNLVDTTPTETVAAWVRKVT